MNVVIKCLDEASKSIRRILKLRHTDSGDNGDKKHHQSITSVDNEQITNGDNDTPYRYWGLWRLPMSPLAIENGCRRRHYAFKNLN